MYTRTAGRCLLMEVREGGARIATAYCSRQQRCSNLGQQHSLGMQRSQQQCYDAPPPPPSSIIVRDTLPRTLAACCVRRVLQGQAGFNSPLASTDMLQVVWSGPVTFGVCNCLHCFATCAGSNKAKAGSAGAARPRPAGGRVSDSGYVAPAPPPPPPTYGLPNRKAPHEGMPGCVDTGTAAACCGLCAA